VILATWKKRKRTNKKVEKEKKRKRKKKKSKEKRQKKTFSGSRSSKGICLIATNSPLFELSP
jgi:hypothetical protein